MADTEGGSEQDDVSFLRTDDMVCLQSTDTGTRVCLAAEGFGNRHCFLENIADKNIPPEISSCVFVIEQALSVRALQEMITAKQQEQQRQQLIQQQTATNASSSQKEASSTAQSKQETSTGGGSRTLLYGHAVLLRHGYSKMYLACLSSTSSSSDKLAFDVGLQEQSQGEACWWTVHPASKQRSEGEKVRVGDEIILVSVATERYLHTAKEHEINIVDASFKLTHWSVAPFGTGSSRTKNVGFVFGGDVLRFYHGGDECLTVAVSWNCDNNNLVVYEGGAVMAQARSLWRLDLVRTKWSGGFINWGYPLRIQHITTGRYLGINENNEICLLSRDEASVAKTAFCLRQNKDDKKMVIDEKEEEVIGSPLIKYGDTSFFLQHIDTGFWLSYKSYETKKRGVGRVEEKQAILSEEGKMDDGLEFSRSQEEEAKTARVIRKCEIMFNKFIATLNSLQLKKGLSRGSSQFGHTSSNTQLNKSQTKLSESDQEEMVMCLEDLIAYFSQPEEDSDHEEKQLCFKALRNRQDLFQEEGILNLILETIDQINAITTAGLVFQLLGTETSETWASISGYLYQLLASVIKGNHTNCAQFAQAHRLDWLFSRFSSQAAGEGTGMLDVLHCVLTDSPEALNMMKEDHIKVIISLLEKHGRDPKILHVLCSLCVGNGVAVRSSQNNICDNLLPSRSLLLQTRLVDHVASMRPNIFIGKVEGSSMYRRWYFELEIDDIEQASHLRPHFRVGWANTTGYIPYPSGGSKWGGNGVGDDLYSYGFDGKYLWTSGENSKVRRFRENQENFYYGSNEFTSHQSLNPNFDLNFQSEQQDLQEDDNDFLIRKGDVIGCILDLDIPLITFTTNGIPVRGCFKGFNTDGMFFPVISFSAKVSCRFLFGEGHGRLKFGPPIDHSPLIEALLPTQQLKVENCFEFGQFNKGIVFGPSGSVAREDSVFVPHPVDTSQVNLPGIVIQIRDKLAENIHEMWAMGKIEAGWKYGEIMNSEEMTHPCLTNFDSLPVTEKKYDFNLALQTLKTIIALGYKISKDNVQNRIKVLRLPNELYLQSNNYKPCPMDLSQIQLSSKMEELVDILAENTHNVWASERIKCQWSYALHEDSEAKRSPHLVPYKYVDEKIKKANRTTASETVKTLLVHGYILEPPSSENSDIDKLLGRTTKSKYQVRSYRAEKTYAATSGKWYYEVEILTTGPMKIGWATLNWSANSELGDDENSWSFDCSQSRKHHFAASEQFGKNVNVGDIIGCMLDLNDKTICFSLNGELLLDSSGGEIAFSDINTTGISNPELATTGDCIGFVPAFTLGVDQKIKLIFGQDINALKCFTNCGLQEGYQPFCVNMNKNTTLWYSKEEPLFVDVEHDSNVNSPSEIEVVRIPGGSDSSPALKISNRLFETQEKVACQFLRLSLPVVCHDYFIPEIEWMRRKMALKNKKKNFDLHSNMIPENNLQNQQIPMSPLPNLQRQNLFSNQFSINSQNNVLEQHILQSGFSMNDIKGLQRTYSEEGPDDPPLMSPATQAIFGNQHPLMLTPNLSPESKREFMFGKTKSFDNNLTVPSIAEAQKMMKNSKKATSTENLDQFSISGLMSPTPGAGNQFLATKKRSRSPFNKLFGKKEPTTPLKSPRSGEDAPSISIYNSSFQNLATPTMERSNLLRPNSPNPNTSMRRGSKVNITETLPDESNDLLDSNNLDLVDEYFYGVRIFPGQDPNHVFCGWVTSNFKYYGKDFNEDQVRQVSIQAWNESDIESEVLQRQDCYMLNAGLLYNFINENEQTTGRSNQGMFVGCHIDVSTGILTFTANDKPTKFKFRCEPGSKLYPSVFFEATTKDAFQFELGRTPETLPLSALMLKSTGKHLQPQFISRLKVQMLKRHHWSRCSNKSLKPHALKLSNIRGWSMLVDEPVSMLALHLPEENRCIDILELIEHDKLLTFHAKTLCLYGALCYQGNTRAAHMICTHVDTIQLMYAIQSEYMSGPLRSGFADLLIALHLEQFAYSRSLAQNEFIIALDSHLKELYEESENASKIANSISTLECASIRSIMKQSERVDKIESVKGLSSPYFPVKLLKQFVMEALNDAVKKLNRPMRDPIGGSNENLFVPLIKLVDKLLLIGCIDDCDLEWLLYLIDPTTFKSDFILKNIGNMVDISDIAVSSNGLEFKGLMQMQLDEGVKLQMSYLFHHLFDLQLRHRVESCVSFSSLYVKDLQEGQLSRYISVKQEDLPAAVAAKKTKEFRCAPKEQMKMILSFNKEGDEYHDICTEDIKQRLFDFHENLLVKIMINKEEEEDEGKSNGDPSNDTSSWNKILKIISLKRKNSIYDINQDQSALSPDDIFYKKVVSTITKWAKESEIENRELIRQMFSLLLRSYDGVGEVIDSLEKTYIISSKSKEDVEALLKHLDIIRSLLPVQMSFEEEEIMRETLWTLVMNRVFFQHPDLIKILRVHENVMDIMTNTLSKRAQGQSGSSNPTGSNNQSKDPQQVEASQDNAIGDTSAMVVACCRFLCYFCRSSRLNQKAMFQHLNFLLENSNILLSRPSLRGSTPLDVASSSVMENPELALALRENYLEKIAVYLSKCGFQSNQELLDKGYPDIGWDPVEGERYLDFFRTCVWVNGESVEENANLVIRLLIRRPECLGPALRGEGEGLLQAIKDAIILSMSIQQQNQFKNSDYMSNDINNNQIPMINGNQLNIDIYPSKDDEDYVDIGASILNFYCGLVDLLGRCAPEATAIAEAKNECIRARAILRSLVPISDLEGVLALRFNFQQYDPNAEPTASKEEESDIQPGIQPIHKQSVVLFLERVYGIESQEVFFRLLEDAFLPDLRAATILEKQDGSESQIALALNRYIGNAILPLLIKNSHFFNNAEQWSSLMDATLHTVYRLCKVKILTKGQREMVSDFLVALTHEMQPSMLLGLLRKLTVDVSVLTEYSTVALRLLTLHYERCGKYYSHSGQTNYGTASAEERKLTMLLFSNIFDSLSKMEYDPDLFNKALPCLTAIACALPPDYTMATNSKSIQIGKYSDTAKYTPNPVSLNGVHLPSDLMNVIQKFAEHYHDAYAQKRFESNWSYGDPFNLTKKFDPKLKPFHMLSISEQNSYKQPITDSIKTILALNWKIELQSNADNLAMQSKSNYRMEQRCNRIQDYNPNPVDMSSLTLTRELLNLVEKISENSHELWAEQTYNLTGGLHLKMVPYDLLTDKEKKDNRELSQELVKYLQYEGYNLFKMEEQENLNASNNLNSSASNQHETRFASSLLTKLLQYLEATSLSLKLLKPSENYSRRNSFKQESRDIKFFSKVVLPLVERLFQAHRIFFLTSMQQPGGLATGQIGSSTNNSESTSGQENSGNKASNTQSQQSASQTSSQTSGTTATAKEKEMVAQLFCKLADLLRSRLSVMGADAKISVRCLQVLINACDLRTIVRFSPDFVKTSMLTFFNHASDDLANCVLNLQQGKFTAVRGTTIKSSTSLNYIQLVLLPVLTSFFDHLASNDFGPDLLVNDIQVACYKILNSLYTFGTNSQLNSNRKFVKRELDFHRTAIGNCLGAFACTFPVAFLEPHLNKNNKNCIHSRSQEYSLEAQGVMADLEALMPTLEDLMTQFDKYIESGSSYAKDPSIVDIVLPMLCSYLFYWYQQGPENVSPNSSGNYVTMVTNTHLNQMLKIILNLIKNGIGQQNQPWMNTLAAHSGMIIINSTDETLLEDPILPLAKRICASTEKIFHREDVMKGYLKSQAEEFTEIETQIQEEYSLIVRDIYAFLPLLIKYVDLQRSHWLKNNTPEAEQLYHSIAAIFSIWSKSQYFLKEEQNFILANEIDNMALIMPLQGKLGRPVITKSDRNVSSSGHKVKKKKRDGKRDKDKEIASSLIVSALKKILPVGLNLFAGREQELVQYAKDKILKKENETDILEYIKIQLNLPEQIDPSDAMSWQHYLYSKLGSNNNSISSLSSNDKQLVLVNNKPIQNLKAEDKEKIQEKLIIRIIDMAKVLFGLHMIDHPSQKEKGVYRSCVSTQRKRAVIACFRMVSLHQLPRHRAMNIFLYSYKQLWLSVENIGQEKLIEDLTESFEEHEKNKGYSNEQEQDSSLDPLIQLVTTFSRSAITEHGSAIKEDDLYMKYAHLFSESCGGPDEEEDEESPPASSSTNEDSNGEQQQQQQLTEDLVEEDEGAAVHEEELEKQKTLFQQLRLADRGLAEMILLYISACKGQQNDMVFRTLRLGISILRGGNTEVQHKMICHLKDKKDVGFFTSIAGMMNSCSVLDLDAFERNQKAEGLGVGSEGTAGEKNMHDAEFSCALFRFIQLLCEGHNLEFQNYLRTQAGNTTTVNVIIITVDYLLRLQESMMDFYWHYSSKQLIDPSGQENFTRAITVAKQVFSTLTESIQGPCQGNQQALAHSRLWDAVGGFLFLFAHMQDKLSKNSSQLNMLIELLDLQKEMVVMMLSMLEGNVVNGAIGRQMVDTFVESSSNLELILKFFDMFLKLKSLTSSASFQELDKRNIGWITATDFKKAMEQQKVYTKDEIEYLMDCCEPNHDGLIDYIEFTERFHNPAKEIGFNLAVLLTNLSEHMPGDLRLARFLEIAASVLNYFEPFLGRIEIMGSAKRVERVYFEIQESSLNQWEKPQIKESKRAFLYQVVNEGGDKEKLELFVNFCEDAIFEMKHAASISMEDEEENSQRAATYPFINDDDKKFSLLDPFKKLGIYFLSQILRIFSSLTPANLKKQINALKEKTLVEIVLGFFKLIINIFIYSGTLVYSTIRYVFRIILRLMSGDALAGSPIKTDVEEISNDEKLALPSPYTPRIQPSGSSLPEPPLEIPKQVEINKVEDNKEISILDNDSKLNVESKQEVISSKNNLPEETKKEEIKINNNIQNPAITYVEELPIEIKSEQTSPAFKGFSFNIGSYTHRFICFLARNFYTFKNIALVIAFVINFILLFYKISTNVNQNNDDSDIMNSTESSEILNSAEIITESILQFKEPDSSESIESDEDLSEEFVSIQDNLFYLTPFLRLLAVLHSILSLCLLFGYYHLKLPLAIFKREKEISRAMEFDGLYITEQNTEYLRGQWDKIVISTPSFPVLYWDKFVKKRVRETYSDQFDYESITKLLGMTNDSFNNNKALNENQPLWKRIIHLNNIDFKYQVWKAGVTITDQDFLYNLAYLIFSLLGNINYFFFAAHLLDIAFVIKSLRTILQSVTHNGRQLVLTVILLVIIVYIYTVIAFNFFRKFYVQSGDEEGGDGEEGDNSGEAVNEVEDFQDKKCHSMSSCFIFNLYQGVRAGGGIGDVIEPPDGDTNEYYRIVFDITFFFFVIVILLAILQGLIIDAFGELRDQLQSVSDDMESNCFICGIGKDYFDKIPHGFETHVKKEHDFANYLFFLMHLINKPDTDYTGQETYVFELYQKRCWDFFPVGECFRKQYEEELSGVG
uniref:Ryanodine receptor n=1 Tax=Polyphagotarsonemus latus TaxID=1204166 RepID=A0AAN0LPN8_9ACAR